MTELREREIVPPGALEFDLADRMRKALRAAGISVQEMADYLNVTRQTVGRYINGKVRPDTPTQMVWAMRCGVPYEWLAHGVGPKAPMGGPSTAEVKLPHLDSNQEPSDSRSECHRGPSRAEVVALSKRLDGPRPELATEFRRALGRTGEARSTRSPVVMK